MLPFNDAGMVSGLLCGALFGWVLENAGFGSPCKLTGQFRLSDWSVLKVMFTAIVVAAAGLLGFRGRMGTDPSIPAIRSPQVVGLTGRKHPIQPT